MADKDMTIAALNKKRPLQKRKVRRGGWTAKKKAAFLDHLAATCNVAASARKVRMGEGGVYALRRRCAEFRAGWALALAEGYARLELMLLERAMNGTVKTVTRANGAVETTHEYPNALALSLLSRHRASVAEAEAEHDEEELEEVRRRILRKLEAVRKRAAAADEGGGKGKGPGEEEGRGAGGDPEDDEAGQ